MKKDEVIVALSALAQSTRLDILRFLVSKGPEGAAAGAIAAHIGTPASTLTFHVKTLTEAGLLVRRRAGRQLIYRVDFGALHAIIAYLLENCCAESGQPVPELVSIADDVA
ncbi:MAG: helix-turn-helix domain-containing protein [Hyphomicrobiales bacterium]|nr:helix-turn-helix domain-containing protein [Hyphomicrobiales bacterium]